jgi:hypothetical protein
LNILAYSFVSFSDPCNKVAHGTVAGHRGDGDMSNRPHWFREPNSDFLTDRAAIAGHDLSGHRQFSRIRNGIWKLSCVGMSDLDISGWFARERATGNFKSKVPRSSS